MALLCVSYQSSIKKMVLVASSQLQRVRRIHDSPFQLPSHTSGHRTSLLNGCKSRLQSRPSWVRAHSTKSSSLSITDVAEKIKEGFYSRILVMAGAGISTDSGIPDFRSPTSGLYSKLQDYSLPYPEAIFDLSYFLHEPSPFLRLSQELLPGRHPPNSAHYFLRLLHDKGILLRLYTQNIDGLERAAGIPAEKLVEAHGTFASSTCTMCLKEYPGETFCDAVTKSQVPHCSACGGLIKPDIVFFGEQLPARFFLHLTDFPRADLLFVMGTSLEVEPFASLVYAVRSSTPRVLINRDPVGPFLDKSDGLNVMELGDVTSGVKRLVHLLGWERELEELEKNTKNFDNTTEDLHP
ncbi:NAD-dependent protein deacetylase sirtuin-3, mitochondrial isoform X1 [Bufo gargarizans]|uniref:NAD-dependent protein deacetylase sirtuin-3, mitochondrial isoform X1 n=2 Tax=Bufo gargarizans TaxID=30331 RepID=UPI001CF5A6D4|nr:NAD-dependent protein deacetylase sirtuin-3, mitochondrial isoform X1 [Bufo gargarizans]